MSESPGTLGALGQYTANASLQDYNTWYGQQVQQQQLGLAGAETQLAGLETVAGYGTQATNEINQAGQTTATNIGNIDIGIGNTLAAGKLAQAATTTGEVNALTGVAGQGLQQYLNAQYYQNLFNPAATDPNYYNQAAGGSGPLYDATGTIIGYQ